MQVARGRLRGSTAERGSVLVMFALGMSGFLGLVGMSVDIGRLVYQRTDLQKVADAAALAAAQDLPDTDAATATVNSYVAKNGGATATIVFSNTYSANDTITVTATRDISYWFLRFVGMTGASPHASAKTRAGVYVGGSGLVPWGLIASNNYNSKLLQNACYLGQVNGVPTFKQNTQCVLKYGAGTNSGGDFGALSLGGSGGSLYRANIGQGSSQSFKVGDQVPSETGNMQGPSGQGIADRFSLPAPIGCPGNDRDDVLMDGPGGVVSIRPGCEASPRIVVIPVVDKIQNPEMSTILGFAFMYLTGSSTNGGQSQVTGEFVKYVTAIPGGVYQGSGSGATTVVFVS